MLIQSVLEEEEEEEEETLASILLLLLPSKVTPPVELVGRLHAKLKTSDRQSRLEEEEEKADEDKIIAA